MIDGLNAAKNAADCINLARANHLRLDQDKSNITSPRQPVSDKDTGPHSKAEAPLTKPNLGRAHRYRPNEYS